MRQFVFLLSLLTAFVSRAQTAPMQPAQPAPAQPGQPVRPQQPQQPPQPSRPIQPPPTDPGAAPGSQAFVVTNQAGRFTNQFAGATEAAALEDVAANFANLQASIEQALPFLAALASQRTASPGQTGFFGTVGTNVVGMTADTHQLLVALQYNLQRILPALQQLNGVGVSGARPVPNPTAQPGAAPGTPGTVGFGGASFANRFILITNANQRILQPTGR